MVSILILSPHPDDLEISAGFLSLFAIEKKYKVYQMILTDGRYGGKKKEIFGTKTLIRQRRLEAITGASILGIKETRFLNVEDGKISEFRKEILQSIKFVVKLYSTSIIVAPSISDNHVDHKSTGEICQELIKDYPDLTLISYCFWGDCDYNTKLFGNSFLEKRNTAISQHKSQPIDRYFEMLSRSGKLDADMFQIETKIRKIVRLFKPNLIEL